MRRYDYIFAGGGAAGLSLAYAILRSSLRDRRILIVDRDRKTANDRTWCFWSDRPTHFTPAYFRSWEQVGFQSTAFCKTMQVAPYRYNMLRAIDFYEFTLAELSVRPNIEFLTAPIMQVWDTPEGALLSTPEDTFQSQWLFDSRFGPDDIRPEPRRYHYLKQHFLGWEIKASQDVFDPAVPILFDFRTGQFGEMRFVYILPYTSRTALVEYTLFSANLLNKDAYETGLRDYIHRILGLETYEITAVESGVIPMTDHPLKRRTGEHILNIGTRGGRVKPSSGYAFSRILRDSSAVVRSLEKYGHPFQIPESRPRYRLFDSMLLQILSRQGVLAEEVFTRLFQRNPVQRIFGFLDETGGLWDNVGVMASVPPAPFIKAWFRLKILHSV